MSSSLHRVMVCCRPQTNRWSEKMTTRLMGRIHDRQCDCNIEQHVSGAGEKCNHRYGVKRQRAREKREWSRDDD